MQYAASVRSTSALLRCASLVASFLVAWGTLSACGGYLGVREPLLTAYNERWERRLNRTARTDLACRNVRLIPLSDSVIQADGCNRVAEYGLFCLGSRDCTWRAFESVAAHASRDMTCHEAALAITATGPTQRNVYGCGRTAQYDLVCAPQHCVWTASGMSAPVAPVEVVSISGSADVVIPPPPGASGEGTAGDAVIPPPPGAATGEATTVIPPPPGASTATSGGSNDTVVIPPPP
jgi:hypothetical protein